MIPSSVRPSLPTEQHHREPSEKPSSCPLLLSVPQRISDICNTARYWTKSFAKTSSHKNRLSIIAIKFLQLNHSSFIFIFLLDTIVFCLDKHDETGANWNNKTRVDTIVLISSIPAGHDSNVHQTYQILLLLLNIFAGSDAPAFKRIITCIQTYQILLLISNSNMREKIACYILF
ncbi:unnamed protein product [Vicia faba]|uniref:Uncharacterized protein n=1 Tax=Vicia faba TaxID=3906 RepID=A0AAV1AN19_VICFA|nr:unnamed protein product [Vicia faba]CAI8609872.1 unnamed protein product [Vicia faba]